MRRVAIAAGMLAAAYAIGFAFLLVEYTYAFGMLHRGLIRSAEIRAGIWVSLLPLTLVAMRPLLRRTDSWMIHAAALTAICFAAALLAESTFLAFAVGHGWFQRPFADTQETPRTLLPTLLVSIHSPFAFLIGMTMTARWLDLSAVQRNAELRVNRLETRLSEARAHLLRSQLHPHFLFNALNSVAALIRSEPDQASGMLEQLARFYAIAAATEGRQTVSLAEELNFVRQYIDLEQIRFGPRLRAAIVVPEVLMAAEVPTLILQALAENAIKHGIGRQRGPGNIVIAGSVRGGSLQLSIDDSGVLERTASPDGVGLPNTRERLRQLYGDEATLMIEAIESGTRVTVTVPLRLLSHGAAA